MPAVRKSFRIGRVKGYQDLRDSEGLRQQIHGQLSAMQSAIDDLLVERPRRRILRSSAQEAA
jgi:hypothetical protein